MKRLFNVLVALDIFVFALITLGNGDRGETISAAAWGLESRGRWQGKLFRPIIDGLFFFVQKNHCKLSWDFENHN